MRTILLSLLLICIPAMAFSQVVATLPAFPTENDAVEIIFDASLGTAGLKDYTGEVYAHTGVITDRSTSGSDWKYAPSWGDNSAKYRLESLGDNKWKLNLSPSVRGYYGVEEGEKVKQLVFVFRSGDNSKEGKDTGGKDIYAPIYAEGLNVSFSAPLNDQLLAPGTSLPVQIKASAETSLKLYLDDSLLGSEENATELSATHTFDTPGSFWLIAEGGNASATLRDSLFVTVRKALETQTMPSGVRPGINYTGETSLTLVLHAPQKEYIYLIGDFNDWKPYNDFALKRDGDYWWISLNTLTFQQEYAFQYYIDGSLKIADPYADKILDEYNDPWISTATYPDLKPYPKGKTEGIVSVLQTGQEAYEWQVPDFQFAYSKDKLLIYELLVRDFVEEHTFDAVAAKLDYLQSLGVNVIELMPVNEFEGNSSWGYNPSFYFAVDKYYGTKESFKRFVDACHSRGMAVVIDMVLNHAFGQCPFVQLYWDAVNNRPLAESPWFNVTSPNTAYSWGADFNHESPYTQALVDSINSYWMQEYKVDGFRFDFTKGFTNTGGDGWAYDQSRIDILKRMTAEIRKRNPAALVIFEHLADNSEEKVLADDGILLWGNMNNNYCEAQMGWTEDNKSDLTWALSSQRGWEQPVLVSYMESHDEERATYKATQWGNASGTYSIQELPTALERAQLNACFYLPLPGPRMIWQFGELGYDYSINTCGDLSNSGDCRTDPKPIRWDYYDEPDRKALFDVYTRLNALKKEASLLESTDVSYSLNGAVKHFIWRGGPENNAFVVGNFDVVDQNVSITIPASAAWYDLFTGAEAVLTANYSQSLAPGEYRFYVDNKELIESITSSSENIAAGDLPIRVSYLRGEQSIRVETADSLERVMVYTTSGTLAGAYTTRVVPLRQLPAGMYIVQVKTTENTYNTKIIKF